MSTYSFTISSPSPTPSPGSGVGAGLPSTSAARALVGDWDLRFDPVTMDLVDDGVGGFEVVTSAATAVMHQMLCHFDEWWGDAEMGSRLHRLELFIAAPGDLIADECLRALRVLEAAGRITDLTAEATETAPGRVDVRTSYRDMRSGQPVDLTLTPAGW